MAIGGQASVLQPSANYHTEWSLFVVVRVDDFLCAGKTTELESVFISHKEKYDLTKNMIGANFQHEPMYMKRMLRGTSGGFEIEIGSKNVGILLKEWAYFPSDRYHQGRAGPS